MVERKKLMLKTIFISAIFGMLSTIALAEQNIPDPGQWYVNSYTSLWSEEPWNKMPEILSNFYEKISLHGPDYSAKPVSVSEWLTPAIAEWKAEGWVGSDVDTLKTDRINLSTTQFKIRWLDKYANSENTFTCSWYLADFKNDQWRISNYADIKCDEHEF
jgi:hypothetical protein